MKVIITGADGQVGWELQKTVNPQVQLIALNRQALDITKKQQVVDYFVAEKADWVINAAAYTAVDKAEENSDLAYQVNYLGAENIALACKASGSKMLHISTDFIFDGSQSSPYLIDSKTNPVSVYGKSKHAGDQSVLAALGDDACILRASWIYSSHGHNFVKTMIKLMNTRSELSVVGDQIGSPTWANGLARALWCITERDLNGVLQWSDHGVASWYDFAMAIYEQGTEIGLINNSCQIKPIRSSEYPTLATRPQYSVLDKSETIEQLQIEPEYWRFSLRSMLLELKKDN